MADLYKYLDDNIKRSNRLGDWESPIIYQYQYWQIRREIPIALSKGANDLIDLIVSHFNIKGKYNDKDKYSFYFWMKDQIEMVARLEQSALKPIVKNDSLMRPSPRANKYGFLLELKMLSGGNPILAEKIKRMPYEDIFDMLLAFVIESEATIKDKK